jgi:multisubunit Na+/H+ antiporter MnhF subunit
VKKQWVSQLVISISLILILLSQVGSVQNWSELSSIRQGIYIVLVSLWVLHLISFLTAAVLSSRSR